MSKIEIQGNGRLYRSAEDYLKDPEVRKQLEKLREFHERQKQKQEKSR